MDNIAHLTPALAMPDLGLVLEVRHENVASWQGPHKTAPVRSRDLLRRSNLDVSVVNRAEKNNNIGPIKAKGLLENIGETVKFPGFVSK